MSPGTVKFHVLRIAALLLLLAALAALAFEFAWRWRHELLKPQALSPDGAYAAEVRGLPAGRPDSSPTGVYLRTSGAWLRSVRPQLTFSGECDNVDARWFGPRRLVIECELRAGEPRLLQPLVGDVAIELVVQRRFAWRHEGAAPQAARTVMASRWKDSALPCASRLSASFTPPSSTSSSTKFIAPSFGST
jgi:hypothetical protein